MGRIVLLLVLLLLLPVAAAQSENAVAKAFVSVELDFEISNQTVRPASDPRCNGNANSTLDVILGEIQFSEGSTQTGCGLARATLPAPVGAEDVELSFLSTRSFQVVHEQFDESAVPNGTANPFSDLTDPTGTGANETLADAYDNTVPANSVDGEWYNARQSLVILGGDPQEFSLYNPEAGAAGPDRLVRKFDVGELGEVRIGWFFADDGRFAQSTETNVASGVAFSANISDVQVRYPNIRLEELHEIAREPSNDTSRPDMQLVRTESTVVVPASFDSYRVLCVQFDSARGEDLTGILGPDGTWYGPQQFARVKTTIFLNATTGPDAIDLQPGNYTLIFERHALQAAVVQAYEPGVIWLLPLIFLILPLIGAVVSAPAVQRYRRAAGRHDRNAFAIAIAWLATGLAYIIGIATLFAFVTWLQVSTLDWNGSVVVWVAFILFIFIAYLALWRYAGFTALKALRKELAEKKRMNDELARSNHELETFAYVASHDLQEPLRKVASFTQLLQRRYHGKLEADADEFIDHAVEGARRMQQQIQDLLEYSRAGRDGERHEENLQVMVEEVVDDLDMLIQQHRAKVAITGLPDLYIRGRQIRGVFQNLIQNAIKFKHPDRDPVVVVTAVPHETEWQFEVRDNGIGIEAAFHKRIFDVFQRLHRRDEYEGTGIGLSIVKKIIEHHGGKIWVKSQVGEGTSFFFTLPRNDGST